MTQIASKHYTHGPIAVARHSIRNLHTQMHTIAQLSGQLAADLGGSNTPDYQAVAAAMTTMQPDEKEDFLLSLLAASREIDDLAERGRELLARYPARDQKRLRARFNAQLDAVEAEYPVWLLPTAALWREQVQRLESETRTAYRIPCPHCGADMHLWVHDCGAFGYNVWFVCDGCGMYNAPNVIKHVKLDLPDVLKMHGTWDFDATRDDVRRAIEAVNKLGGPAMKNVPVPYARPMRGRPVMAGAVG